MEPRAVKMEWEKRRECGAALCEARHCARQGARAMSARVRARRRTQRGL